MSRSLALALAVTSSLTLAGAARAQQPPPEPLPAPTDTPPRTPPRHAPRDPARPSERADSAQAAASPSADSAFVTKAAEGGAKEVAVAKLAADKASSADVKAFAKRLAADHSALNSELTALAASKHVDLPARSPEPPADLASSDGAAFDRAFLALMVQEHEAAIALFEGESRDGRDSEVKEWAARQLPALRDHLATAKTLKGRAGS
jgi:putative membrane protein